MLSCKKDSCSPTCNEVFLRSKIIVVHVVLNPPGVMPRHKHRKRCECKQPAVWSCFFENQVVITLMCKLKQIDINPGSNCPRD